MDRIIETLERHYKAIADADRDWDFFLNLTDYVNLLDEIPQLKSVIEKLMEGETKMRKSMNEAENLAIEELKALSKKILAEAGKKKRTSIKEAIAKFKEFDEGRIQPEWWHSVNY
jgi:predicted RecB family endonuclease